MTSPYALIIEDDPKLGVIYQTALQQAGYETDLDENGNHYRALLDARQPDLVILDIHLPFAFGGDILNEIRAKHPDTMISSRQRHLQAKPTISSSSQSALPVCCGLPNRSKRMRYE
jgi:DNA-binding response OmpR family regulator